MGFPLPQRPPLLPSRGPVSADHDLHTMDSGSVLYATSWFLDTVGVSPLSSWASESLDSTLNLEQNAVPPGSAPVASNWQIAFQRPDHIVHAIFHERCQVCLP